MNKKEIFHLLKRYHYIDEAIQNGKPEVIICISGRKETIQIDRKTLMFAEIVRIVCKKEENDLIKSFIDKNIMQGQTNTSTFVREPLDRSTYYFYKNRFVDILYHCCISKGLVSLQDILEEDIIKNSIGY